MGCTVLWKSSEGFISLMGKSVALQITGALYRHISRLPNVNIISKLLDVNLIQAIIFSVIKLILLEICAIKFIVSTLCCTHQTAERR